MKASQQIDNTIEHFFSIFDNRDGKIPDFSQLRALFSSCAVINKCDGGQLESMSLDDFILPREALLTNGTLTNFCEWKTKSQILVNREIATVLCHYEKQGEYHGEPFSGSGVKHIQLVQLNNQWKITAIVWLDDE